VAVLEYYAVLIDTLQHFCTACSSHLQWWSIPRRRWDREAVHELPIKVTEHPRRVPSLITLWRDPEIARYEVVTIAEGVKY